jgi:cellulose synthase/poly-beta-1,6-N-acetylglucosamine synthase-like glycosyltransferase
VSWWRETVWIGSLTIFLFFVVYTLATLMLIGLSLYEAAQLKIERGASFKPLRRALQPGVSVLVPAYDEQPVIVSSVRSMLASDYEPLEIVIVDDGSSDRTTETLIEAFDLVELPVGDRFRIETAPITELYVSRAAPRRA